MLKKITNWILNFSAYFFPAEEQYLEPQYQDDHIRAVHQARQEWHDAKLRFDQITDPDLIDSAIYAIEAAEKRYIYLLKKAREERESRLSASRN